MKADLQKGWTEGIFRFAGSVAEQLMMPAEASRYQLVFTELELKRSSWSQQSQN